MKFPAGQVNQAITIYLPLVHKHPATPQANYVLLGWNDLGMHCYNRYFQDLAVLPPL